MKIISYIQPRRTYLPCTGIGRHINGVLAALDANPEAKLRLLFAREHLGTDGRLPQNAPLRDLAFDVISWPERPLEQSWKLLAWPDADRWIARDVDWIYCPMEVRIPSRSRRLAITVHDARVFEPTDAFERDEPNWAIDSRMKFWLRRAIEEADLVFTVSDHARGRLIELLRVPEHKVALSGNGLGATQAQQLEDIRLGVTGPDCDPAYVVSIGGLRPMKGGAHLLELARALRASGSKMRIVVVGGPNNPLFMQEAEELSNIDLLGHVDDEVLFKLVSRATALLILSLYEGFGLPAVEAMALGTPVICSDRTSLPEVVGEAALLVTPTRMDNIIDALGLLADRHAHRQRLIEAGVSRAARFRWTSVARRVLDAMAAAA